MANNAWLRALFGFVLFQALLLGQALIWPARISLVLPWPATPLNARFVAALYCMGVVTSLLTIFAVSYAAVRVSLVLVGVITGGLLVLTLPHLGEFTADTFPYRWVAFYTLDSIVMGLVLWRLRGRDVVPPGRTPAAPIVLAYAAVLAVAGVVMLAAPSFAVHHWPWGLTTILAQVYSVFFLTFAIGGWLAARDPRPEAAWIYLIANLATALLVLGVSAAYPERFKPGLPTWIWYVVWGAAAITLMAALARTVAAMRRPAAARVAS
jgi:hypothetical protein